MFSRNSSFFFILKIIINCSSSILRRWTRDILWPKISFFFFSFAKEVYKVQNVTIKKLVESATVTNFMRVWERINSASFDRTCGPRTEINHRRARGGARNGGEWLKILHLSTYIKLTIIWNITSRVVNFFRQMADHTDTRWKNLTYVYIYLIINLIFLL